MIEFVPGAPWADIDEWGNNWHAPDNPFMRWREAIRSVALELEKALGEPVYHFADLDDELNDDAIHRFLVLHWCCTWKPESAFVRYLLKLSGATDVEELKEVLIDPASYTQPFKMNNAFMDWRHWLAALSPQAHKIVAIVFSTSRARDAAQLLLAQKIGAHAFIVAPKELATDEWVKQATHYLPDWTVRYVHDGKLDEPIDILVSVDELCVIANEPTPKSDFDLKLSNSAEDLLWLALALGVDAAYFLLERSPLANLDVWLRKRGAPERIVARQAQRAAFTRQLPEIRLDNDSGGSGLCDAEGRNLGYDLLDLLFPLVRRVAAWQRDYDNTMNPPDMGDGTWRERHKQETLDIAKELQAALGSEIAVKLYRKRDWLSINEVEHAEEDEQ